MRSTANKDPRQVQSSTAEQGLLRSFRLLKNFSLLRSFGVRRYLRVRQRCNSTVLRNSVTVDDKAQLVKVQLSDWLVASVMVSTGV